jgi:hypothetical protein
MAAGRSAERHSEICGALERPELRRKAFARLPLEMNLNNN